MPMRWARFSGLAHDTMAEGTESSVVSRVALTFREHDRPNPTKDNDGKLGRLLSRQYRAFVYDNPNPIQQKCVPPSNIREPTKKNPT